MSLGGIKASKSMICLIYITLLALLPFNASAYDKRINPSPKEDEYIIPHSAEEKLSIKDLSGLDIITIELAKNEIYARHGLIFQHELMNAYFKKKTWYKEDRAFKKDSLNYAEAANVRLLEDMMRDPQKLNDTETELVLENVPADIFVNLIKAEIKANEDENLRIEQKEENSLTEPSVASAYDARINLSPKENEYIIPHSAEEKLSVKDLLGLDIKTIELAKNEIYARHGLIFQHELMNAYFKKKTWYKADRSFKKDSLNYTEAENVRLLESIIRNPQNLKDEAIAVSPENISADILMEKTDELVNIGELIIATARAQIGKPYKYGSADPEKGFDCSGLVNWVYKQHGINTPRSTPDLEKFGISIPPDQLKIGDIVISKNRRRRDSPHGLHAGIYSGNGMMIHAPGRRRHVIEVKITNFNVKYGRRVI